MIDLALDSLLLDAAQQTLETMFFAVPDSVSSDAQRPAGELIAARLAFHGSPDGSFGLLISEPLAEVLAANFLGCEAAEVSSLQITGVVGELANMICGAVLTKVESDTGFDIAAPATSRVGADEPAPAFAAESPWICRLEFPEGTLLLFLSFGDPL